MAAVGRLLCHEDIERVERHGLIKVTQESRRHHGGGIATQHPGMRIVHHFFQSVHLRLYLALPLLIGRGPLLLQRTDTAVITARHRVELLTAQIGQAVEFRTAHPVHLQVYRHGDAVNKKPYEMTFIAHPKHGMQGFLPDKSEIAVVNLHLSQGLPFFHINHPHLLHGVRTVSAHHEAHLCGEREHESRPKGQDRPQPYASQSFHHNQSTTVICRKHTKKNNSLLHSSVFFFV